MRQTTKGEHAKMRAVCNVLATAPGLGAFAVAVAMHGLNGAVALCETREPCDRLKLVWRGLGYTMEQLPSHDDIKCILAGAEAARRHEVARKLGQELPALFVMAEDMECSAKDIHRGMLLLKQYGAEVSSPKLPSEARLGAI